MFQPYRASLPNKQEEKEKKPRRKTGVKIRPYKKQRHEQRTVYVFSPRPFLLREKLPADLIRKEKEKETYHLRPYSDKPRKRQSGKEQYSDFNRVSSAPQPYPERDACNKRKKENRKPPEPTSFQPPQARADKPLMVNPGRTGHGEAEVVKTRHATRPENFLAHREMPAEIGISYSLSKKEKRRKDEEARDSSQRL
jgi:hypothetical protein